MGQDWEGSHNSAVGNRLIYKFDWRTRFAEMGCLVATAVLKYLRRSVVDGDSVTWGHDVADSGRGVATMLL
jgi:hypothetical protein